MYCKKCGTQNDDGASVCVKCGEAVQQGGAGMPLQTIPNYLVWSILVTILCCLPLGIPAIIFSSQVNQKIQIGDENGAMEASKKAKMFCWLSFGLGLAGIIGYGIIMIIGIAAGEY